MTFAASVDCRTGGEGLRHRRRWRRSPLQMAVSVADIGGSRAGGARCRRCRPSLWGHMAAAVVVAGDVAATGHFIIGKCRRELW